MNLMSSVKERMNDPDEEDDPDGEDDPENLEIWALKYSEKS